jgi:hypothetical protein
MKKYAFITMLILMFPLLSNSQSIFLDQGTNAGSLGIGIGNMEDVTFYTIQGSYSLKGRTDLSLAYEKSEFGFDSDLNKLSLGANYLILKQGSNFPLNWNLGGSYSFGSVSDEELSALGTDLSINEVVLSTGFSRVIRSFLLFAPYATVDYNRITAKASYNGDSESESESGINYTVGGHLGFHLGDNLVTLNPFYSFGYFQMVGVRLSFILNAK